MPLGARHAGRGAALHGGAAWSALDREGKAVDLVAKDFFARVIQHETDHLNGIVYVDRIRDMRSAQPHRGVAALLAWRPRAE